MSTPGTTTASGDYADAYPNSFRVHDESAVTTPHGVVPVRVPMREVRLSGGEPSIRLYDTSGPRVADVRVGLPKLREPWVAATKRHRVADPARLCARRRDHARDGVHRRARGLASRVRAR